jgi:uncharacterized protein YjaZ
VAHELNHSKRILDGPGYGTTLGEAIVTEGLADNFSIVAYPETPPIPWTNALQPDELDRLGADDLPRWAGYTIGATWVRDFLTAHPEVDATAATLLTANEIIDQ